MIDCRPLFPIASRNMGDDKASEVQFGGVNIEAYSKFIAGIQNGMGKSEVTSEHQKCDDGYYKLILEWT